MAKAPTKHGRASKKKRSRHQTAIHRRDAMDHAVVLIDTVCCLAGADNLIGDKHTEDVVRLRQAIRDHDTPYLFGQLIEAFSLQGVSNSAALSYMDQHGHLTWHEVNDTLTRDPICTKLNSYWSFHECGYQKGQQTCARPSLLTRCGLPKHDLRNGRLNQTAYSLFLFIRDVTQDGDFVGWIDGQLKKANEGSVRGRTARMRNALIEPLRNVFGVSDKVLNMTLAYLLTAAPETKPLWLEVGPQMNAVDTLVHNFLHRTGILRRFGAEHPYGTGCYGFGGCADVITKVAAKIDARECNSIYPRTFPRWVQHSIWRWCAQGELDLCNGNRIDDRSRCDNKECALFDLCDRVPLQSLKAPPR